MDNHDLSAQLDYSILKSLEIVKSMWKVQMNYRSLSLGFKERNKSFGIIKTLIQTYIKEFGQDSKLS